MILWLGIAAAQSLEGIDGVVELRTTPEAPWRPADPGERIEAGMALRTFQGEARLALDGGGMVRLAARSELVRGPRSFELLHGRAFAQGEAVRFEMSGLVQVSGAARFDREPGTLQRLAVLSGEARATVLGRIVTLQPRQQLVVLSDGEPQISDFEENDPWYLDRIPLAEGAGRVLGSSGDAELRRGDGPWRTARAGDPFTVDMQPEPAPTPGSRSASRTAP